MTTSISAEFREFIDILFDTQLLLKRRNKSSRIAVTVFSAECGAASEFKVSRAWKCADKERLLGKWLVCHQRSVLNELTSEKFSLRGKCMRRQGGLCLNTPSLQICICIWLACSLPHKNKIKRGYLGGRRDARLWACHRQCATRKGKHGAKTESSHHSRWLAVICCLSVSDNNRHSKVCCQLPFCALRLKAGASFEAESDRFYTAVPASSANAFSGEAGISKR